LLMLRNVTPAHKRLSLSGFLFLRTIFTIQGTHRAFVLLAQDKQSSAKSKARL
jgi:hypothetical protein